MTPGNGNNAPTVTGSTPQNGRSKLSQAIVKQHILTHVIEGFVIQEGAEPFPVERPSFLIERLRKHNQLSRRPSQTTNSVMEHLSPLEVKAQQEEPMLTCELCGKVDFAYIFKRSKRFCSMVCAKRYNVGCTKRVGLFPNRKTMENLKKQTQLNRNPKNSTSETKKKTAASVHKPAATLSFGHSVRLSQDESTHCLNMSSYQLPHSPTLAASSASHGSRGTAHSELAVLSHSFLPSNPGKWNVENVYEFICSLPGCLEIAEEFRSQEIDGQALLLLKEDHLMGTMNIKLGPALKIFAQISMLKDS
ncbi:polyhomeotic-like protein 2 [Lampris incognitus]|uniref:polyhomeotic-like protein 2 n=1 Tax=Lampris incognitus TaxID=2546036 RepID=UPI0024B57A67|nr:polyhomeotic-like protein 2 [Lampris incognitus]